MVSRNRPTRYSRWPSMRATATKAGTSIDVDWLADAMGENARDDVAILLVRRRA